MNEQKEFKDRKIKRAPVSCVWGLICSMSSTDQSTNNISLFNIIEVFNLPTIYFNRQKKEKKSLMFPLPHEIILYWRRLYNIEISGEEILAEIKFKTLGDNEKILQETIAPFKLPSGMKNLRFKMPKPGLVADSPGGYIERIEIKFSDEKEFKAVYDIPFEITEVKEK